MTLASRWLQVVELAIDHAGRPDGAEIDRDQARLFEDALAEVADHGAKHDTLIGRLARQFGLTLQEELALWTLVAHQIDARLSSRIEAIAGGTEVTIGALVAIAYGGDAGAALDALSPSGRMFRYALVERADKQEVSSWIRRSVRGSDRLLQLAIGALPAPARDTRLRVALRDGEPIVEPVNEALPDQLAVATEAIAEVRRAFATPGAIVVVSGMPGLGRRTLLATIARELGHGVLELDAKNLARDPIVLARQLRAVARECRLLDRIPLVANLDALATDAAPTLDLVGSELVAHVEGLVLATTGVNAPAIRWSRSTIGVSLAHPSSEQRGELWIRELGQGSESDAELLATQYPLAPALIHRAAGAAKARANGKTIQPDDVYAGIRGVLDDRLGQYARRVTITQTWDDLVLSQDHVDTIDELVARVRERRRVYEQWGFAAKVGKGLGISALFSGPPGTGKTMVASLIANDLGVELYQVDLGKIVSKYIGETEKHLAALFDAAEAGHAILLFDEADSLFGKRTDVKSSNDRYANLETNYLLQRLETFTGICLLTSNHAGNIDLAFQRRLSLHLRFELPSTDERAALWRAMLPAAAPVAPSIDFQSLARRYEMSGGYIRNAALRAAFLASNQETPITAALLERAARLEYESMGKLAMA